MFTFCEAFQPLVHPFDPRFNPIEKAVLTGSFHCPILLLFIV
jgi:hypothetical protein